MNSVRFKAKEYEEALIESFIEIDKQLMEESEMELRTTGKAKDHEGGTTACVALITEDEIYVANCGDSRCVMSRKGEAIQMSMDHRMNSIKERKRIQEAGGTISAGRINGILGLPRSLGDLQFKDNKDLKLDEQIVIAVPDVKVEKLNKDVNFLFIACDGVWDCMGCQEVVTYLNTSINKNCRMSSVIGRMFDEIVPEAIDENCIVKNNR